jgi:Tfp pilus assembly protein FimT
MPSPQRFRRSRSSGFSLIELLTGLIIIMVLVAVAMPTISTAMASYRLGSSAEQLSNLFEVARYSAIKRNTTINLLTTVQGNNTLFYVDLLKSGTLDPSDPQVLLPSDMIVANGQPGVPAAAGTGLAGAQDFAAPISFDYRGTVTAGGAFVLIIGLNGQPQYGFRAVSITPMGQAKAWTASANGQWNPM